MPVKQLLCLLVMFSVLGCAGHKVQTGPSRGGHVETGQASFYAAKYHGQKTASGERLDQQALTAAHPSLPFGTLVNVTNLKNKKSVRVRINDRGPFVKGRVIDLTQAAFRRIGPIEAGLIDVRIEVVQ